MGYGPWGHKEPEMTEATWHPHTHTHTQVLVEEMGEVSESGHNEQIN